MACFSVTKYGHENSEQNKGKKVRIHKVYSKGRAEHISCANGLLSKCSLSQIALTTQVIKLMKGSLIKVFQLASQIDYRYVSDIA